MTSRRWALTGLAVAAALAALVVATRRDAEPASAVAVPAAPAVAAAPASPGAPALPLASGPAPTARAASAPLPAASRQAPAPAPAIGSEGYGPHIERALAGGSPDEAWEALRWLQTCASAERAQRGTEVARAHGVAPELMTQLIQAWGAEIRRCQTVTARHQAMRAELAARAMQAGIHDAAVAYANAVSPAALSPAERCAVAEVIRRDAEAGFPGSLMGVAESDAGWGFSDEERLRDLFAFGDLQPLLGGRAVVDAALQQGTIPFQTPPTPAQLAAGQRAGAALAERIRASHPN